jgi:hypothetical protein
MAPPAGDHPEALYGRRVRTGGINSIGFENDSHEVIVGFDHALNRLGLRDRQLLRAGQLCLTILLGLVIAREIVSRRLSWPARLSLVSAYSLLFLYHRMHDAPILVVPMIYAAGRARDPIRGVRLPYEIAGLACLATMWLPGRFFKLLTPRSFEWGMVPGWAFRAGLLPWATWGLLLIIGMLILAERRCSTVVRSPPVPEAGDAPTVYDTP